MTPPPQSFYKATCPDGTDFYSGRIDYAEALRDGTVIEHPAKRVPGDPSTYLSVSVEPADCTGMRWPCRLFRVEPVGRAFRDPRFPNKRCCRALKVVEELPAHMALGPNGREVAAVIERAGRLTDGELEALSAARDAARSAALFAAGSAAGPAAGPAARFAARFAARDAARFAAGSAARSAARDAAGPAALDAAGSAARDAAGAAALALMVRNLITVEQFELLYGPWREVVGDVEVAA